MPLYEYACRDCGSEFEKLVRSAAASTDVECPVCKSNDTKKKLSTFASKSSGVTVSMRSTESCAPGGT